MSKSEKLFEAEAALRFRARQFAGVEVATPDQNAREIDECFDDEATP